MPAWTEDELAAWQAKGARMDALEIARWGQEDIDKVCRIARFDQMRLFLMTLFSPYQGEGFIELRAIQKGMPPRRHFLPCADVGYRVVNGITYRAEKLPTLKTAFRWATEHSAQGFEVYCGVLPRCREAGRKKDVMGAYWIWADVDFKQGNGTPLERENYWLTRMEQLKQEHQADMVVLSGFGMHLYWKLTTPFVFSEDTEGLKQTKSFEAALYAYQQMVQPGADSTQDTARVLRLPGTFNRKQKSDPRNVLLAWAAPEIALPLPQ